MVSERLKKVGKVLVKECAGSIPFFGKIAKSLIEEFSPDEKKELIKELKELSEIKFEELRKELEVSENFLKEILKILRDNLKITIPTIQAVLKKDRIPEGEFFRDEGPKWIDFEEGFVAERKEVDEIIQKLETDNIPNIQLVVGEPASGKSVILKNIGFKLAKNRYDVYIIELKDRHPDRIKSYFNDAREINDEKTLLIVDDAHLELPWCKELIRDFNYNDLRTKLIIGSRDVKEVKESPPEEYDFGTQESLFKNLARTKIYAINAADWIISLFLKRKRDVIDVHQIADVSRGFDEYKHDLWWLAWSLTVYDKENTVNKERIYKAIANKKIKKINAEDVFLPLSVFYRFEIPIERDFLEEQLEIEEDKIDQLIKLSEISETEGIDGNEMLSLHHSSIADLYFETYKARKSLGRKTKKKIIDQRDEDLEYCLFYKYMTSTDPRNAIDVVFNLGRGWFNEKGGKALLKKLIGDDKIQKSIEQGIEKEEDIRTIGLCMSIIAKASKEAAGEIINRININTLSSKIKKDCDISIRWDVKYVRDVAKASEEEALKLVDVFSSIKEGELIRNIGWCVGPIAEANEEIAREIINRINNPKLRWQIMRVVRRSFKDLNQRI